MLRSDGLYCLIQKGTNDCFRFEEDGTVIHASIGGSDGTPAFPRAYWFHRNNANVSRGRYTAEGDLIVFITVSAAGKIEYRGTVGEDRIILSCHSYINGFESFDDEYVFYPFDAIAAWNRPPEPPAADEDDDEHDDDNRSQDQY